MRIRCAAALIALASYACGEEDSPAAVDLDSGADAGLDEGVVDANAVDAGVDTPEEDLGPYFPGEQYILPDSHANVVRRLTFSAQLEPGVALGFDLDGRDSAPGDEDSCGHGDAVGPDGITGIDNQFAVLWSAIEPIVGVQVEELLQGAINEGLVLVMLEITDFDDLQNDDSATFNLFRGRLDPQVGTMGLLAPDQTYYYDYSAPLSSAPASITDGQLVAGPVEFGLPITILDLDIILPLREAFVRLQLADDGTAVGVFGGTINIPSVAEALLETGAAAETRTVLPFFEANADMNRVDGECQDISVAVEIETTTAFVVRDAAQE